MWIFPYSGEKYHTDMCTYVKAAVIRKILSSDIRKDHRSCALCDSDQMKTGDIVFCFSKAGTAYHRADLPYREQTYGCDRPDRGCAQRIQSVQQVRRTVARSGQYIQKGKRGFMWDNREFRIRLEENTMKEYERVMLTSGECSLFMPMGFMSEDGGETVCYNCSGFTPLSSFRIEKTEDVLYILERTLLILERSVEFLITPAKICLSEDTVFYNKETGEVKIAYIPAENSGEGWRRNIVTFLIQIKKDVRDENIEYINRIARCICSRNYYIRDIINKIGLYRREIYAEGQGKGA